MSHTGGGTFFLNLFLWACDCGCGSQSSGSFGVIIPTSGNKHEGCAFRTLLTSPPVTKLQNTQPSCLLLKVGMITPKARAPTCMTQGPYITLGAVNAYSKFDDARSAAWVKSKSYKAERGLETY